MPISVTGRCEAASTRGREGETLTELRSRKGEILTRHKEAMQSAAKKRRHVPLMEVLGDALDDEDDTVPCAVCAL